MISRLRQTRRFLIENKRVLLGTAAVATSAAAFASYKSFVKKNNRLKDAYEKFRPRVESRSTHHSIQSLFAETCKTRYQSPDTIAATKRKSMEMTTQLDATHYAAPLITHEDGSKSELNALSAMSWREFVDTSSDEIYISFGHRKAFSASNPIRFTHAVIYVVDTYGNHAIYGYTSNTNNFIINDSINTTVSRDYTLYPDLTIKGNKKQAQELFQRMEFYSLQRYTFIGCNCYSPLISGLLEAKDKGFAVPSDFNDSLLIVIPAEQNYGMGITSNRYIKPLSESAITRAQTLFAKYKDKASIKFDEMKEKASQKLDKVIKKVNTVPKRYS